MDLDFPEYASQISALFLPLRDWEPMLLPARADVNERVGFISDSANCGEVVFCSRLELALRTFKEGEENKKIRQQSQHAARFSAEPPKGEEDLRRAAKMAAEYCIHEPPLTLCRPLVVTSFEDCLRKNLSVSCAEDELYRLKAILSCTLWWKYRHTIPGCIRDLVWYALMNGCIAIVTGHNQVYERMRDLIMLLIDGNWPIARDREGSLFVLVAG